MNLGGLHISVANGLQLVRDTSDVSLGCRGLLVPCLKIKYSLLQVLVLAANRLLQLNLGLFLGGSYYILFFNDCVLAFFEAKKLVQVM